MNKSKLSKLIAAALLVCSSYIAFAGLMVGATIGSQMVGAPTSVTQGLLSLARKIARPVSSAITQLSSISRELNNV